METVSIVAIALAVLVGGRSLLVSIAAFHAPAAVAFVLLAVVQTAALRRNERTGGALSRVRVSRDIAFLAALLAAATFVASPARWSLGAAIAAVEFGLVVELLARLASERQVAVPDPSSAPGERP